MNLTNGSTVRSFAVEQRFIKGSRLDTDAYHPEYRRLLNRINELAATATISEIMSEPTTTGFAAGHERRVQLTELSVPQIRPTQILMDGEIDLSEAYGIPVENISDNDYLHNGEVLFNNTNSTTLVGKSAVFHKTRPTVCSNHITRLRIREDVGPEFIALVLNLLQERRYFAHLCTNFNNQAGVNSRVLGAVRIPLPASSIRTELVSSMNGAMQTRKSKLVEADSLIATADEILLEALAITPPDEDPRKVFAVRREAVNRRLDPHFHSPAFSGLNGTLSSTNYEPLGSIARFSDESWSPQRHQQSTFRYVEISTVDSRSGDAYWNEVKTEKAPSRARMLIRTGDIIISLTRPHHGSIAHVGPEFDGCVASTGFAIIREVASHVLRDYLWCALRTRFCRDQMLQRASGGNYPAITERELSNIAVPVPDDGTQAMIVSEIRRRLNMAAHLRAEGEDAWRDAKDWFGEQLLGP